MDERRVIAVDIGGTKIAAAEVVLGSGKPKIGEISKAPTLAQEGGTAVLARVIEAIRGVLASAEGEVCGIGISSAGVIDPSTGDVTYANEVMPGWGGTHLGSEVSAEFGLPCKVLNDVHAHALGEARHGAGAGLGSCLVAAVGTGIGSAFVDRGRIMLGEHSIAGHLGHLSCFEAVGIPCACGRSGHLESVAAGPGIIQRYIALGGNPANSDGESVDGAEIDRRARRGEREAVEAEQFAGGALGHVLGSVVNMLDPAAIVLSGSVAKCCDVWWDAVRAAYAEQAMDPAQATPIVMGSLGDDAPLIGAAENLVSSAYE